MPASTPKIYSCIDENIASLAVQAPIPQDRASGTPINRTRLPERKREVESAAATTAEEEGFDVRVDGTSLRLHS